MIDVNFLFPHGYVNFPFEVSGHGIWGGAFYLTAGGLGIAATVQRTRGL